MIKQLLLMQPKQQSNAQKKTKKYYSGKKKKHTIKTQIIIEKESKTIIAKNFAYGKTDDFRLFKESKIPLLKV
ncbi:transposase family protein [Spiroplasma endosymbiont of Polydrusus pterygomalis]|uniref:transposase family protein n=1 Tax=Spiroplasma endosymbiont of Polydrusus pterygomalis TaxID=3139327 RepID=UPI003CCAC1FD